MRKETTGAVCPDASPPQIAQPKPRRYTRWSRIKLDLPDAPEHIFDDIFWHGSSKPETRQFLAERGFCGVLWP